MKVTVALGLATIALATSSLSRAQTLPDPALPDRLVIRAELLHGINAAKAKPGDKVEMRALAAEKDGDRVLIEKDAKLTGHVTSASARGSSDSESRMELVIDRAQWKGHSLRLKGYVIAQGELAETRKFVGMGEPACDPTINRGHLPGNDSPAYILCAQETEGASTKRSRTPVLRDVELRYIHGRSGPTVLVSRKSNVVLPAGLVVLIRNVSDE